MEIQKTLEIIQSSREEEKTPMMILQEICTKLSIATLYEEISTEGQEHEPTFEFRVK